MGQTEVTHRAPCGCTWQNGRQVVWCDEHAAKPGEHEKKDGK